MAQPLVNAYRANERVVLLLTAWAVGAAILAVRLDQGWMRHDDGSLAHSAQRILAGELPHRDFAELYTGGLAFMDAAVFSLFGEDMLWLRVPLYLAFLGFVPCFFAVATRFVTPFTAFLATLIAVTWTVPAYPAPMPSWYLLFLSVFAVYAVLRFLESNRTSWLFVAGLAGGIAICVKITGIWLVLALTLAVVFAYRRRGGSARQSLPRLPRLVVALTVFNLLLVSAVVRPRLGPPALVELVLPVVVVSVMVVILSLRRSSSGRLDRQLLALALGVAAPVALLMLPYLLTGSVDALVEGVLVAPRTRFDFAYRAMPSVLTLLWAVPVAITVVGRRLLPNARRPLLDVCVAGLVLGLGVTSTNELTYPILWNTARALAPIGLVLGACAVIWNDRRGRGRGPDAVANVVLVVLVATFMSLTQFPFSAPIYFLYVVPLVLLALLAVMAFTGTDRGVVPIAVLAALVCFGAGAIDRQSFWSLGVDFRPDPNRVVLDEARADVRVRPIDRVTYRRVLQLIRQHRDGRFIFAGPDAPEVYFLSDSRNPTRAILDFLDTSGSSSGSQLVSTLDERGVTVVAMNRNPLQSPRMDRHTVERLRRMYPNGEAVGRFEVRWR